jgi:GTP cyclohydrolase II
LQHGLESIAQEGRGVLLYLKQEGRGIGLLNKVKAYKLQDAGADTVEANEHLGFDADLRDYSICQSIFEHLGISQLRLMTNNPVKVAELEALGVEVVERLAITTGRNRHNEKYLATKAGKLGHFLSDD